MSNTVTDVTDCSLESDGGGADEWPGHVDCEGECLHLLGGNGGVNKHGLPACLVIEEEFGGCWARVICEYIELHCDGVNTEILRLIVVADELSVWEDSVDAVVDLREAGVWAAVVQIAVVSTDGEDVFFVSGFGDNSEQASFEDLAFFGQLVQEWFDIHCRDAKFKDGSAVKREEFVYVDKAAGAVFANWDSIVESVGAK